MLGRVRVTKTFSGDVVGTSRTDLITVVTAAGPRAYVGVERVAGSVHGRSGSFVFQHSATSGGDEDGLSWTVVRTPVRAS